MPQLMQFLWRGRVYLCSKKGKMFGIHEVKQMMISQQVIIN